MIALKDLVVNQYRLDSFGNGTIDIVLQRCQQEDGSSNWKIAEKGFVLNCNGEWEFESIPSSRTDAYFKRTRFDTAEEALDFWNKIDVRSRFERYRTMPDQANDKR